MIYLIKIDREQLPQTDTYRESMQEYLAALT